jgi:hypothetical protein
MRMTSTCLVAVAMMIVCPDATLGQDKPDMKELVICQPPDCDISRSLPIPLEAPLEAQDAVIALVKDIAATVLDPDLPAIPFQDWLLGTLVPNLEIQRSEPAGWSMIFCAERRRAVPFSGLDLCVEIEAPITVSRTVMIVIQVAEGHSPLGGRTGWIQHPSFVREIYIQHREDGVADSLDVARLSGLWALLRVPLELWPAPDFRSAITWSPQVWKPGDLVRFGIWVENVGKRDAHRAELRVLVATSPSEGNGMIEVRRAWFPRVPAGKRVGFEISAHLPRGDAIVSVTVMPSNHTRMREINPDDNDTTVLVGADLVPGPPRVKTP